MKSKLVALTLFLTLMPMSANGQAHHVEAVKPMSSRTAEPMHWRDGYITWKGRKISEPDWLMFKADSGATFAVDRSSIKNISPDGLVISAVAYFVEGDDFDPNNLISFAFGCLSHFTEVVTKQPSERVQFVEKQVKSLACH
jgi:hypothetical protein